MPERDPHYSKGPKLAWDERVALWNAVLARVRACLRGAGLLEVSTPVRVQAPAVEPHIEPVRAAQGYLATSPELAMKRLLCRGSGSIFQISHCFRAGERGAHHSEEFHLLEWYRADAPLPMVMRDVEAVVAEAFAAAQEVLGERAARAPHEPWVHAGFLDLFEETAGVALRGDESAGELVARTADVSEDIGLALAALDDAPWTAVADPRVRALAAWTRLFTAWSAECLPSWLFARGEGGVHLVDFPAVLSALARCGTIASSSGTRHVAHRFESYVHGLELANGYWELRDAAEQRARFEITNALRRTLGHPPLPLDEGFLRDLADLGLPDCSGVALGLDRLVMLVADADSLDEVALAPTDP
jgi:lysyl-tRNA synthetase class 2